jgi:hypothetical protein
MPSLFLLGLLAVAAIQAPAPAAAPKTTAAASADERPGVTSVLYVRDGGWRPMLIQNTLRGHAMRPAAAASPSPTPAPR